MTANITHGFKFYEQKVHDFGIYNLIPSFGEKKTKP